MGLLVPMIRAVLLLPVTVLVLVPGLLLWLVDGPRWFWDLPGPQRWMLYVPVNLLAAYGFWMGCWTCSLFLRVGRGTPAPWDPPRELVIRGPYRFVRNPMMSAVFALLISESLATGSRAIVAWTAVFVVGNLFYIPLSEEPGLVKRFGASYEAYRRHVPRWIPRLTPYEDGLAAGASSSSSQKQT